MAAGLSVDQQFRGGSSRKFEALAKALTGLGAGKYGCSFKCPAFWSMHVLKYASFMILHVLSAFYLLLFVVYVFIQHRLC